MSSKRHGSSIQGISKPKDIALSCMFSSVSVSCFVIINMITIR